jgi:hypothetical protein
MPDWMKEEGVDAPVLGLDMIKRVVRPPRIVIVQSQSQALLDAGFEIGDIVMLPAREKLPNVLHVTPLIFYPEYVCLNPRELKQLEMVRERSLDPTSDVAQKCKRLEVMACPEDPKYTCKYQENLIFICFVEEVGCACAFAFYRSEHKTGTLFASKINARNKSIFYGRYMLSGEIHKNEKGRWHGFAVNNAEQPWVSDRATVDAYSKAYDDFLKSYNDSAIEVDYEEGPVASEGAAKF